MYVNLDIEKLSKKNFAKMVNSEKFQLAFNEGEYIFCKGLEIMFSCADIDKYLEEKAANKITQFSEEELEKFARGSKTRRDYIIEYGLELRNYKTFLKMNTSEELEEERKTRNAWANEFLDEFNSEMSWLDNKYRDNAHSETANKAYRILNRLIDYVTENTNINANINAKINTNRKCVKSSNDNLSIMEKEDPIRKEMNDFFKEYDMKQEANFKDFIDKEIEEFYEKRKNFMIKKAKE